MSQNHNTSSSKQSPQMSPEGLSEEAIENIKREIIYGVGYQRPPEHTRFQKGQSGNPKGRPKKDAPLIDDERSANALALREAERQISVREGGEVRVMTTIEAIYRAQCASALKGNAHAQWRAIDRYDQAKRERQQMIAREVEVWQHYVEQKRKEMAEAAAHGKQIPAPLPHPDDVVIDRATGVRFSGPITDWELERLEDTLRLRDILIMQEGLDQRSSATRFGKFGSAICLAHHFNSTVPVRFKLTDTEMQLRFRTSMVTPKRQLLKTLYRSWREHGWRFPRGFTFPPVEFAKRLFETLPELVELMRKIPHGEFSQHEFEESVSEIVSRLR